MDSGAFVHNGGVTDPDAPHTGQRGRIRRPAPPAPAPAPRTAPAARREEPAPILNRPPTGGGSSGSPASAGGTASAAGSSGPSGSSGSAGTAGAAGSTMVAAGSASGTATGTIARTRDGAAGTGAGSGAAAHGPATGSGASAASESGTASDADVVRSTGSMAVATLFSRITGFLRNALIGITLGPAIMSAFNTANTLPNLITEIVLGAVLTSLVVPVLVRAQKEDADGGAAFVRRLMTLSLTLLGTVTVLAVVTAPILTRIGLDSDGKVNVPLATSFAFLLLPQIIFYGIFSLLMAVLNTKGVFKPGAWAPVANNVVAIATLLLYWLLPGSLPFDHPGTITDPHILLLGVGTTLGVVIQALIMIPPLRRLGIDMRPLWGIDDRIKQFGGMGIAIVTYVAISQAGYLITTRIASSADDAAPGIYQQAWLLLQMPYGIIGVTLLTAIMPRLSRNAADGDDRAVIRDLSVGTRLTMIALIPIVVFFTAFGVPISNALFAYGLFPKETADILGWTLSFSAFTLIPYALVLLHLRVFYAREEAWTPTFIIFGITVVKVALSMLAPLMASRTELVVVLLGAANGFGFVAGAIIGGWLLRRTLGDLRGREVLRTCVWALGAALVGIAVAMALDSFVIGDPLDALGSVGAFLRTALAGIVFLIVTGVVLSRSPLPEVRILGGLLGRIPGLRRFAPKPVDGTEVHADDADAAIAGTVVGGPSSAAGENAAMASEGFTASPMLPPMPSEASRPTRFVPGEMVFGGRYRLLSEEGSRPGVRFWRAVDRTGPVRLDAEGKKLHDEVALTFVDTLTAPHVGYTAPGAAVQIAESAKALRRIEGPGLARIRAVHLGRTDVIVASDWVPGIPLSAVGEGTNADAAAFAVADLAEAAGRAHKAGLVLGADDLDRLRVSVDGRVELAFPAPLPEATADGDLAVACRALSTLLAGCTHVPSDIRGILDDATRRTSAGKEGTGDHAGDRADAHAGEHGGEHPGAVAHDGPGGASAHVKTDLAWSETSESHAGNEVGTRDGDDRPGQSAEPGADRHSGVDDPAAAADRGLVLAKRLREAALGPDSGQLQVIAEDADAPITPARLKQVTSTTRGRLWGSGAIVVGFVLVLALILAAVFAWVNRAEDSPLTPDSVRRGQEEALPAGPIRITDAAEWQATNPNPLAGPDNPSAAAFAIDGDRDTSWMTSTYNYPLGSDSMALKKGIGLVLTFRQDAVPGQVEILGAPGTKVEIRSIPADLATSGTGDLGATKVLGQGRLGEGDTTIALDGAPKSRHLLIWVTELPDTMTASIAEVSAER
ncbi:putative peptidoglycan biosynthesis protein MviN [Corynebacterium hansenii]|nr:putative peptidoglycan biosynthesis protein MviN [Corynebacterium hansenii]